MTDPRPEAPPLSALARKTAALRARIPHPVIDADGHAIEYLPLVYEHMQEVGGPSIPGAFRLLAEGNRVLPQLSRDQARAAGAFRMGWWGLPTETVDRATAMLPRLMVERMGEIGLDFAVLYPTYGLIVSGIDDAEVRQASARAFNRYFAEEYGCFPERIAPAATVPCHTPEEAIAELDYAVQELGFRAVMLGGTVRRPLPGQNEARAACWIDALGHDSAHDYAPLWRRCVELGVSPTFHSSGLGWITRNSLTNYIYNKLGSFTASQEALCRSLFFAGVAVDFPELRFAFLEAGTAWACTLYSDLFAHWEKRNVDAVTRYDPARLDRAELRALFERYGSPRVKRAADQLGDALHPLSDPQDPRVDDFGGARVKGPDDIRRIFADHFFFGCEADDRMNATAFDPKLSPDGSKLNALFASDIGHWDVPDIGGVLLESHELVDQGLMTDDDYRDFVFTNPVRLWAGTNPRFFQGTAVESEARKLVEET